MGSHGPRARRLRGLSLSRPPVHRRGLQGDTRVGMYEEVEIEEGALGKLQAGVAV